MDVQPDFGRHAPGIVGALSALMWIKGTWTRRIGMVVAGCALSYYATPVISVWAGIPEGLAGYLTGLFGMAVVSKIFDTWESLDIGSIIKRLIAKWFGIDGGDQ